MSKPIDSLDELVKHMTRVQQKLAKTGIGIRFTMESFPITPQKKPKAPDVRAGLKEVGYE